jgi:hypothetical protein
VGKPCKSDKIFIAYDLRTKTLDDYLAFMRKSKTFCNGIQIVEFGDTPASGTTPCIIVRNHDEFISVTKTTPSYELLINVQKLEELEYSSFYKNDINKFIEDRNKILSLNIQHIKFGIQQKDG